MSWSEATFPFDKHMHAVESIRFYPRGEVISFIDYCGGRGIEVIPLQNCFDIVNTFQHERYQALREDAVIPFSAGLSFENRGRRQPVSELLREVAALHPSKYLKLSGADETICSVQVELHTCAAADRKAASPVCQTMSVMCEIVHRYWARRHRHLGRHHPQYPGGA